MSYEGLLKIIIFESDRLSYRSKSDRSYMDASRGMLCKYRTLNPHFVT